MEVEGLLVDDEGDEKGNAMGGGRWTILLVDFRAAVHEVREDCGGLYDADVYYATQLFAASGWTSHTHIAQSSRSNSSLMIFNSPFARLIASRACREERYSSW